MMTKRIETEELAALLEQTAAELRLRPRQRNWILQRFFRCGREHGANFRQRDRSRLSQNLIATLIDIAKTEHDRLGFIFGEHERRQRRDRAAVRNQPPPRHRWERPGR